MLTRSSRICISQCVRHDVLWGFGRNNSGRVINVMFRLQEHRFKGSRPRNNALAAFGDESSDEGVDGVQPASSVDVAVLKAQGQSKAEAGAFSEAMALWERCIAARPPDAQLAELHELRAQVLLIQGQEFDAIQAAQKAVALSPLYPPALLTLARAQLNYGEPALAVQNYERLLNTDPQNPDGLAEIDQCRMLAMQHKAGGDGRRAHVHQQLS